MEEARQELGDRERQARTSPKRASRLRQVALAHAYRWAFLVVLAALAGFCLASTVLAFDLSAQMLAALTVTLGVSAFLVLFLLFDRA